MWGAAVDQALADEKVSWTGSSNVDTSASDNALRWALADHLGTIRDVVDNSGAVLDHISYNSFGEVTNHTNVAYAFGGGATFFGYTGRIFDTATGLQNNLHRWYDAKVGKWLSEDPIGFAAGDANLGRYVGNAATRYTDPNGLHKGHHKVVQPIRRIVPKAAYDVFEDVSARITNDAFRSHNGKSYGGIRHSDYNCAVKAEFKKFIADNEINPKKMDASQARAFLAHLEGLPRNHTITKFNRAVQVAADAALKAAKLASKAADVGKGLRKGNKLFKAIPGIGTFMAVVGWGGDAYCKGPANGTLNSAIDAIPVVGTGKIVIELFTGDFIPDLPPATIIEDEEIVSAEDRAWMDDINSRYPEN